MALDDHFDPANLGKNLVRIPPLPVAGFWVRLVAFLVDGIVLSFAAYALATVARDPLLALGPWATVLAGIGIFTYFWLGDGQVGKGRTVGKLLMNLRTVRAQDGGVLAPGPAAARALVLIPPHFWFVGFVMPLFDPSTDSPLRVFLFLMLPGNLTLAVVSGQIVHMAFNPTKQALHDATAGTLVLGADHGETTWQTLVDQAGPLGMERARRARRAGWLCIAIILLTMGYLSNQGIQERKRLGRFEDQARIGKILQDHNVQMHGGERRHAVKEASPEAAAETRSSRETERRTPRHPLATDDTATTPSADLPPKEFVFYLLHRGSDRRPESEIRRDLDSLADRLVVFFREQEDRELARRREAEILGKADGLPKPVVLPEGSRLTFVYQEYLDLILYQKGYDAMEVNRFHRTESGRRFTAD